MGTIHCLGLRLRNWSEYRRFEVEVIVFDFVIKFRPFKNKTPFLVEKMHSFANPIAVE